MSSVRDIDKKKGFFGKYMNKQDGVIRFFDLHSPGVKVITVLILIICIVFAVVALFPPLWVVLASFKGIKEFRTEATIFPSSWNPKVFADTWQAFKFGKFYINSLIVVAGSAVCAVLFNGLLAYSLGVLKPRGYKVVQGLVMWSLLIPATTSMVALFVNINNVGLNKSFVPLWLAMGANAFWVLLFKQFFEEIPKEFMEAARIDGCGTFQIFFKILLPLSKSIIMVVLIFAVTAAWSDFLLPYLLLSGSGKDTVMVRLFQLRTSQAKDVEILRLIVFSMIPPTVIFIAFQKQITGSITAGAIKG